MFCAPVPQRHWASVVPIGRAAQAYRMLQSEAGFPRAHDPRVGGGRGGSIPVEANKQLRRSLCGRPRPMDAPEGASKSFHVHRA